MAARQRHRHVVRLPPPPDPRRRHLPRQKLRSVDIWALPGKHLDTYDQIVVVAIKGHSTDPEALFNSIMAKKPAREC